MSSTSIFRKSSLDRVSSPEQLNEYIRVTNPSVWVILVAVAALLAGVFVWGIFGALPTTVTTCGVATDSSVLVYVTPQEAEQMEPGMTAKVGDVYGSIVSVSAAPESLEEASAALGSDYYAYMLGLDQWNMAVTVEVPGYTGEGIADVTITTDSVRPISFLFN